MTSIDSSTGAYAASTVWRCRLDDGVLSVTLNRPDSLNSLTATMLNGIADALDRAATDPRVKVVRLAVRVAGSAPVRGSAPTIRRRRRAG